MSFRGLQENCFCLLNFCCLGRCIGKFVLASGSVDPSHPVYSDPRASKYLPMLEHLRLSPKSIEHLHDTFREIDGDDSGEVSLEEFLRYFLLQKSRFAIRAFSILDTDGSGELDFGEYVLGLINYLTMDAKSLTRFSFDLYDADGSGLLDADEVEKILKDLYGRRAYKSNEHAQRVMEKLQSPEWSVSGDVSSDFQISFPKFAKFSVRHPALLYPAFLLQQELAQRVIGAGFWDAVASRRRELEKRERELKAAEDGVATSPDLIKLLKSYVSQENAADELGRQLDLTPEASGPPMAPGGDAISEQGGASASADPTAAQRAAERRKRRQNRGKPSRSMLRGSRADTTASKKEEKPDKKEVKDRIKRELRAARKARLKGRNPDKAVEAVRKQARHEKSKRSQARYIQRERERAIESGDRGWRCAKCHRVNFSGEKKCGTCNRSRDFSGDPGHGGSMPHAALRMSRS